MRLVPSRLRRSSNWRYAVDARAMSAPSDASLSHETLVAAVDVVDVADHGLAVGDERREHERRAAAQVGTSHRRARELRARP